MKRKALALLVIGAIGTSMTACGSSESSSASSQEKTPSSSSETEQTDEALEVAFVCPITAGDTNWNNALAGMEAACKEVGYTVNMVGPASLDLEQWVKDMDSAIASGYDLIVTTAVVDVITAGIEKAISSDIPVCLIDTDNEDCGRFSYVGLDNYQLGCALAEQTAELSNGSAKVCMIGMDITGTNYIDRISGFEDTIAEKYPDIEVVTVQNAADAVTAADVTSQVMTGFPEVNCFVGLDGTVPKGIAQTLTEKGAADQYYSLALSIDQQVLDYIRNGGIDKGIGLDYYTMGYQAILNAHAYVNGEAFEEITIPDTVPVDAASADEYAESIGLE